MLEKVLDGVHSKISKEQNGVLDRHCTREEVRLDIFDMCPLKFPRIDGLPTLFYQKYWDIVGPSVTSACLQCQNDGGSLEEINRTLIILILKKQDDDRMIDFRPSDL